MRHYRWDHRGTKLIQTVLPLLLLLLYGIDKVLPEFFALPSRPNYPKNGNSKLRSANFRSP